MSGKLFIYFQYIYYKTTLGFCAGTNPFDKHLKELELDGIKYKYYDLQSLDNKYGNY